MGQGVGFVPVQVFGVEWLIMRDLTLEEIQAVNPLLLRSAVKRTMRLPHTDMGLPPGVFTVADGVL